MQYDIIEKIIKGERLTREDGWELLRSEDLLSLGKVASIVRERLHPKKIVTFVIDRNINYTNICQVKCKFCAFYRLEDAPDAYVISRRELAEKIKETIAVGGTQILMQGGLYSKLGLDYYVDLLRFIKDNFPIHIHSFSPPEVWHIANLEQMTVRQVLSQLKEAGLDSLPGGGAEILVDRVRELISPNKISSHQWLEVMESAHDIGLKSTATMMFGSVDTVEDRIEHLLKLRQLQDKTRGFTAFIPWSFQPGNTELGGGSATGVDYLKMLAVSRIMLDNFPNIQASWVTQGDKVAQIALMFGANDFGGTMLEENVVKATGVVNRVPLKEIVKGINSTGHLAAQRDTLYNLIRIYQ